MENNRIELPPERQERSKVKKKRRRRLIKMEKEKREAHRKECVCVCVQMRAFRVAVMASGGCAFRERISRPLFIGSDDERSQPSFITAQ